MSNDTEKSENKISPRVAEIRQSLEKVFLQSGQQSGNYHQLVGALGEHGKFKICLHVTLIPQEVEDGKS